jgi:hypothetical protein
MDIVRCGSLNKMQLESRQSEPKWKVPASFSLAVESGDKAGLHFKQGNIYFVFIAAKAGLGYIENFDRRLS